MGKFVKFGGYLGILMLIFMGLENDKIPVAKPTVGQNSEERRRGASCTSKLPDGDVSVAGAAISGDNYRWRELNFYLDPEFDAEQTNLITQALVEISGHSCAEIFIIGQREGSELDYIYIRKGERNSGCYSSVGKQGGEQIVNLSSPGCIYKDIIIHEIMHAMGYWHEQSRPDRDEFVTVLPEFIVPKNLHNFNIEKSSLTFRLPYDQNSLMHYSEYAFSIDNIHRTIVAKNGLGIGSTGELTETDIKKIKIITGCPISEGVEWYDGAEGVKWNFNCDFFGNDIHYQTNTRGEDCGGLCSGMDNCLRFAWRPQDGGTCWLKNGDGDSTPSKGDNPDGVCGFVNENWKDGDKGAKWDFNCDFFGNDITSKTNIKGEDCGGLCKKTGGCVRFTWRPDAGGTCWLKNRDGSGKPTRGSNPDGVCGYFN